METVAVAVVLGALLRFLWGNGQLVFDFFDMSAFLDAGYRVWHGQQPYVDFFYNAGPVHLYMHATSFALFGFGKAAVLAHLLFVTAIAFGVTYALARQQLGWAQSLIAATISGFSVNGPSSHPWYDSNACMWLLVGVGIRSHSPRNGMGRLRSISGSWPSARRPGWRFSPRRTSAWRVEVSCAGRWLHATDGVGRRGRIWPAL